MRRIARELHARIALDGRDGLHARLPARRRCAGEDRKRQRGRGEEEDFFDMARSYVPSK